MSEGLEKLPPGWTWSAVGEVADVTLGRQRSPDQHHGDNMHPYIRAANITWDGLSLSDVKSMNFDAADFERFKLEPGDVLLNEGSGSASEVGKSAIWRGEIEECCFQNTVLRVKPIASSPEYLNEYFNMTAASGRFVQHTQGVNIYHIGKDGLVRFPVPVPPLAEQCRIVEKLDALTARLARARAELERVVALAERLRRAALVGCFTIAAPDCELGVLIKRVESGKNLRCIERPPGTGERGVVKVSAVTWGRFDPRKSKTLPTDYTPPEKARIQVGDLLISRANTLELVGAPAIVDQQPMDLFLSDKILRLVVDDDLKKWIIWFLRSPLGRVQIESLATGNQLSMRNISQDALRRIQLPLPETEIRAELIETLETTFARADRLEAEAARARALLDRLEAAILAKAFRGELVPQDPADEPAAVLLDRIRAQRAAAPAIKRGRRPAMTSA